MWDSGGWQWNDQHRADYSNDLDDPRTLQAVTGATNQAKGSADPSNWIPPNEAEVCTYLADWLAIKARWSLSMDQSEAGRIRNLLDDRCPDQTVTQWPASATVDTNVHDHVHHAGRHLGRPDDAARDPAARRLAVRPVLPG